MGSFQKLLGPFMGSFLLIIFRLCFSGQGFVWFFCLFSFFVFFFKCTNLLSCFFKSMKHFSNLYFFQNCDLFSKWWTFSQIFKPFLSNLWSFSISWTFFWGLWTFFKFTKKIKLMMFFKIHDYLFKFCELFKSMILFSKVNGEAVNWKKKTSEKTHLALDGSAHTSVFGCYTGKLAPEAL